MTPAIKAAEKAKIPFRVHEYDHDPNADSYGLEAARALGIEPARVFKTLLVELAGSGDLAVGIVPVDSQLDLKAIASAAGVKKCKMADPAMAERVTGYIVGGISPLGQKKLLSTFLDTSASGFDTIRSKAVIDFLRAPFPLDTPPHSRWLMLLQQTHQQWKFFLITRMIDNLGDLIGCHSFTFDRHFYRLIHVLISQFFDPVAQRC